MSDAPASGQPLAFGDPWTGRLRPIEPGDRGAIVDLLVAAFHDDGGTRNIEPDDARRDAADRALFWQFAAATEGGAPLARVAIDPGGEIVGVAYWFGPERWGPDDDSLASAAASSEAPPMPSDGLARFLPMAAEIEAAHARLMGTSPHLRLEFFAVRPDRQRQGIGGTLIRHGTSIADANGWPAYLETFSASNVRLYEHHGFRVVAEFRIPAARYGAWAMRREPT